jgi:hypothetical protein
MGGMLQPTPAIEDRSSIARPVAIGVGLVVLVVGVIALLTRSQPKEAAAQHPYAAKLQISNLKMSAAENFVGASVTYLDGTLTNSGDKTVTRAIVHVVFKDSMGQVAQTEDLPLRILQTTGPYPDTVDLTASPLAPGQSKTFRLVLEHVSDTWNREYPELQVMDVATQ